MPSGDGEVTTSRLLLRRWEPADLEALHGVFSKPEVWWYPYKRGLTVGETRRFLRSRLEEWDRRGCSQWAAVHQADQRLIGFLGLSPPAFLPEVMPTVEIGWRLDPDYWGQGLATEGGRAALELGFRVLALPEIVSIGQPDNVASLRVMERIGMVHDRDTTHPELGVPLRVYKLSRQGWEAVA